MNNGATLAEVRDWGENTTQTLLTLAAGGSFQKVDTLGATRLALVPLTTNRVCLVSPEDLGSEFHGIPFMNINSGRSDTGYVELGLSGNPPVYVRNESGTGTCALSVLHFYGDEPFDDEPTSTTPVRVPHWNEETVIRKLSVTSSFEPIDFEGADSAIYSPITGGVFNYISPTDEGSSAAGHSVLREVSGTNRSTPQMLRFIKPTGPAFVRATSSVDASLLLFYH